jgi:flagellum-specific peptidoglycan hydrolase FlgJ
MKQEVETSPGEKKITLTGYALKQSIYLEGHRDSWNRYQREWKKQRYATDPEYREKIKKYHQERYQLAKAAKSRQIK